MPSSREKIVFFWEELKRFLLRTILVENLFYLKILKKEIISFIIFWVTFFLSFNYQENSMKKKVNHQTTLPKNVSITVWWKNSNKKDIYIFQVHFNFCPFLMLTWEKG